MKIVIHPAVDEPRRAALERAASGAQLVNAQSPEEALAAIADADALLGKITPEMLAAAQRLRWVQTFTASLEHYMFPALVEHPCTLTNMRGLFSDVIADHVMGYVLCFARNLHYYVRNQIAGRWQPAGGETGRSDFAAGPSTISPMDRAHLHLADCTLGIVGLGAIGSEIARRALAFSLRVLAVDPRQTQAPQGVESLWGIDRLDELLAESDFVVIAAPHTPQTARLFDRAKIQRMKRTAYLINIGRGAIVRLDGLTAALQAGEIAGAALDVFEQEPLPADHPLWQMPQVILTPHVAACSPHIAERHLATLVDNLGRFVRGEPLCNVVEKALWF